MANKMFGDTLRTLRKQKGYTQQQVADLLGLKNKSTLGSWEVGKSEPDGYTLLRLCKLYEIEDIYGAFGEVSPVQYQAEQNTTLEKYSLLTEEAKNIVDIIVLYLFKLQNSKNM